MPALWIAHVTVTDADAYGRYAKLAGPAIAAHGGAFVARGGRYVQLEGKDRARNVVARFPSLEAAEVKLKGPGFLRGLSFRGHASDACARECRDSVSADGLHLASLRPTRRH